MASFYLCFLGTVQVSRDEEPVKGFRSRKALALLGYLAVQRGPTPREQLLSLFWESEEEERARANLSWVLNRLTALLPDCLQADRHTVALQRSPEYRLDVDVFSELVAQGEAGDLAAAVALYRGDFLEGMRLDGCAEFEIWLESERERWRQRLMPALETLIAHHRQRGEHVQALDYARRLLALEPWLESTHLQVMELLVRCGQRSAALAQYESCRRLLAQELGVEPARETTALFERIRAAMSARRRGLPPQPTPFVGREPELAEVAALLDRPDCRLLTILGPGGIGKTRLALEAVGPRAETFLEGVHFVPLGSVSSAESLVSAVAEALQLEFHERRPAEAQLLDYLHGRQMLLVLDGFEHLSGARQLLVRMLEAAPELVLVVTSRERLNLRWERGLEIGGLVWPEEETAAADLEGYSAVRLFLQAARRVARRFALSKDNAPDVGRICRLVEGMPLAIELAAASVKIHTCRDIAQRIEADLGFLASAMRDMPARHRSVRAALAHSWRLLSGPEQQAMMKLSVFRQGFEAGAAEEVAGATATILESLVDKSLLRFLPTGRYEMHELLRQYAAESASAAPELRAEAQERHGRYYLSLLARRQDQVEGAGAARAVEALRAEMGNVRAAWQWAAREGRLAAIERSLDALVRLYPRAGSYQEGEALIGGAIDRVRPRLAETESPAVAATLMRLLSERARLLNRCGQFGRATEAAQEAVALAEREGGATLAGAHLQWGQALMRQARQEEARAKLEEALLAARAAARTDLEAAALRSLGNVCHSRHDLDGAAGYYRQALAIAREAGDRRSESSLLANVGLVANQQGRYAQARAQYEQALRVCREVDDRWAEALALVNLGYVCDQQGDYGQARQQYLESLRIARVIGDRQAESMALACLGLLCHHVGEDEAGRAQAWRAAHLAEEIGDRRVQGYALTRLGHALLALGRTAEAAEVYQQAVDIRRQLGEDELAMESLAGLARVHLARGERAEAGACVEEVLGQLGAGEMLGTDEPLRIRLTCVRVLQANGDARARAVLAEACRLLREQAAAIGDEGLRQSFLHDVTAHRELVAEQGGF